jgi:hypothetical protein
VFRGNVATNAASPSPSSASALAIAFTSPVLAGTLTRSEEQADWRCSGRPGPRAGTRLDAVGIGPRPRRRFAAADVGLLTTFARPAGLVPATLYLRADSPRIAGGSIISVPASAIAALMVGRPPDVRRHRLAECRTATCPRSPPNLTPGSDHPGLGDVGQQRATQKSPSGAASKGAQLPLTWGDRGDSNPRPSGPQPEPGHRRRPAVAGRQPQ